MALNGIPKQLDTEYIRSMRDVLSSFSSHLDRGEGRISKTELQLIFKELGMSNEEFELFCMSNNAIDDETIVISKVISELWGVRHTAIEAKADPTSQYLGHEYRAVSVDYWTNKLIKDVEALGNGMGPQSKVYDIEEKIIREKGKNVICPRDGKPGAAYVDCVFGRENVGLAVIMLSYTWGYTLGDIADGLSEFCRDSGVNPKNVYFWMCCLCINQHRVKEAQQRGESIPFEQFRQDFSSRVEGVGKIVALMAPWHSPFYVKRVWCDFELFTAMELQKFDCKVTVTMPSAQKKDLFNCLCDAEGIDAMWKTLTELTVENADASHVEDKTRIFEIISDSVGFHQVNMTVSQYLQSWMVQTCERHLGDKLMEKDMQPLEAIKLRVNIAQMLRSIGRDDMLDRAAKYLQDGQEQAQTLEEIPEEVDGTLKRELGMVKLFRGSMDQAKEYLTEALTHFQKSGKINTTDGVTMLIDIGTMYRKHEENDEAEKQFESARRICLGKPYDSPALNRTGSEVLRDMDRDFKVQYARVLKELGDTKRRMKNKEKKKHRVAEGIEDLQASREVYEDLGMLHTPTGAELLVSIGLALGECKTSSPPIDDDPMALFREAVRIREHTHTMESHQGAKLLSSLGKLELDRDLPEAESTLMRAKRIYEKTDTLFTPIGRFNMTALGDYYAGKKDWEKALVAYEEAQLISITSVNQPDAKVAKGIRKCKEEGEMDRDKLENLGDFLVPAGGLTAATWNISAGDTNPFEFWVSHSDQEYQNLMASYEHFLYEEGSDKDVPMCHVFSDALFLELKGLMDAEGWNTEPIDEAWWNEYRNRKVISEFMTDKALGEKRLVSMADLATSKIVGTGHNSGIFRPTVVNHYGGNLRTMDEWWLRWRNFVFHESVDMTKDGKVERKRPCQLLKKLTREKYKQLSEEEESMSIELQCLCLALYDAILVWIMMQIGKSGHWQDVKRSVTESTVKKKEANTMSILRKSARVDVICLQKASPELKRFLERELGVEYHVLAPKAYQHMIAFSMLLLRKTKYLDAFKDCTDECMDALDTKLKIEAGELFAVCATDTLNRTVMVASYHADSKGQTTMPIFRAVDRVLRKHQRGCRIIFGIDAETVLNPGEKELGVYDFLDFLRPMGYATAFTDPDMKNNCTTCKARTFLQPQLHKGKASKDRKTADTNPRDHLIFRDADFKLVSSGRDNTGEGKYLDDHNMPCLQNNFPSDHGLIRVCMQPKDNGALVLKAHGSDEVVGRLFSDQVAQRPSSPGMSSPDEIGKEGESDELILGSLNIIGESYNPLEFTPAPGDLAESGGGKEWENVSADMSAKFDEYTIGQAREDVLAGEAPKALEIFDTFVQDNSLTSELSIAKLCVDKSKFDLELDNKWLPKHGRLNPLIFALEKCCDDASLQINSCLMDPTAYCKRIISFYATNTLQTNESARSVPSLLLWDLLCFNVVRNAPDTVLKLASFSYMCEPQGGKSLSPVPRTAMLKAILQPLKVLTASKGSAPIVIGCQEMPFDDDEVKEALPADTIAYRMSAGGVDDSTMSGFIYSGFSGFEDVTNKFQDNLSKFLEENDVPAKVVKTTMRKICVGEFTMPAGSPVPKIAVVDFHCKSFGPKVAEQANFVKRALDLAREICDCPAFGVGDMNIQAKWPKGTQVSQMRHAVSSARQGMMPEEVRSLVDKFGAELENLKISTAPAAGTLTTLKMRTRFQGQPDKEGELAAVHKDFVFVPDDYKIAWNAVGGCPELEADSTNAELLQPSRRWPGDHFAVFCGIKNSELAAVGNSS